MLVGGIEELEKFVLKLKPLVKENMQENDVPLLSREELDKWEAKIAQRERVVADIYSQVDIEQLNEFNRITEEQRKVLESLSSLQKDVEEKSEQMEKVQQERFEKFRECIESVNISLSNLYKTLTLHGNCYLGYLNDKSGLFREGIEFHVKPDKTCFKVKFDRKLSHVKF